MSSEDPIVHVNLDTTVQENRLICNEATSSELWDSGKDLITLRPCAHFTLISDTGQEQAVNAKKVKEAIYAHPLLPLIQTLMEFSELLTSNPNIISQDNVTRQLLTAFEKLKTGQNLLSGDAEVDNLIIELLWVLRFHILELGKVGELCRDFCDRYITCLRNKAQQESVQSDDEFSESFESSRSGEDSGTVEGGGFMLEGSMALPITTSFTAPSQMMPAGTVFQMVQTPQGLIAQPLQVQPSAFDISGEAVSCGEILSGAPGNAEGDDASKNSKRGVLPKPATLVLKSWLFQHIVHPYPTDDQKRDLGSQTGLSITQINNWFINARRRILQPMLGSQIDSMQQQKRAKIIQSPDVPPNRPPLKYWPQHLVDLPPRSVDEMWDRTAEDSSRPLLITSITAAGQVLDGSGLRQIVDQCDASDSSNAST